MTTSSSDSRCTRISPSAVLDDRLDGKDLEWARDHLRRCEACRERVEDFREMLLRVGRLPKAAVGPNAMDQAYAAAVPNRLREDGGSRSFDLRPPDAGRLVTPMADAAPPMYPEITNIPEIMTELEREIFRDEPVQDHPTPLNAFLEPTPTAEPVDAEAVTEPAVNHEVAFPEPTVVEAESTNQWREVPIDSHRELMEEPAAEISEPESEPLPQPAPQAEIDPPVWVAPQAPEPTRWVAEPEPESEPLWVQQSEPESAPIARIPEPLPAAPTWMHEPEPEPEASPEPARRTNVVYDDEPVLTFDEPEAPPAAPPRKSDNNAMRLAVGLGAAACVLLAAVLYEGGTFLKLGHLLGATSPSATAVVHASASASKRPVTSASATPVPTPTPTPANVLYTLGDGASGGAVFRIRPGTAVAGLTRLVFDMHGGGLPSMIVTQPDDSHIQVFFKNTTVSGVPVSGIRSYHVAAVEPGVQSGADGSFLIDLAHAVRVTAFTLPATGSYAWRLVVDLHTS